MKPIHFLVSALVFAAACTPPATPNAQAQPEQAQATNAPGKPGAAPAANAQDAALTPAMFIGRWGDNGDCTKDIVFHQDGTFASYTGGQGNWRLDGDVMTMSGVGGTFQVRVQIIDNSRLLIFNPDGSVGTSQRC
ncbi:MAG: hypothetical protein JNJ63_01685 [Hyphomonadaceae bacterium]|nr:hypothetical protein [Hyphomonadaceae bacterium]